MAAAQRRAIVEDKATMLNAAKSLWQRAHREPRRVI
jgi:hypothetical protein